MSADDETLAEWRVNTHRTITKAWLVHLGFDADEVAALPDTTEHEVAGCEPSAYGYDCTDENGEPLHPLADAADETAQLVGFVLDHLDAHPLATPAQPAVPVEVAVPNWNDCVHGVEDGCMSYRCGSNCDQTYDRMHPCLACMTRLYANERDRATVAEAERDRLLAEYEGGKS